MKAILDALRNIFMFVETLFLILLCIVAVMMFLTVESMGTFAPQGMWCKLLVLALMSFLLVLYRLFKLLKYVVWHIAGINPDFQKHIFGEQPVVLPKGYIYSLIAKLIQ